MSAHDQKSDPFGFVDRLRDLGRHLEATSGRVHPGITDVDDLVESDLNGIIDPVEDDVVLVEAIRIAQLHSSIGDRNMPAQSVKKSGKCMKTGKQETGHEESKSDL